MPNTMTGATSQSKLVFPSFETVRTENIKVSLNQPYKPRFALVFRLLSF